MPQAVYKTFYSCDKCGHEYHDYSKAAQCEQMPVLEQINPELQEFNVGQDISFNEEHQAASRWVYQQEQAKVVKKKLVPHMGHHQYLYWTDSGRGVLWVQDEYGWKLFSPAELQG